MVDLNQKIARVLSALDLKDAEIDVQGVDHSVIATIVSGSFEGMDEAERQSMVWNALLKQLDDRERGAVEFVFTIAPGEHEPVDEAV